MSDVEVGIKAPTLSERGVEGPVFIKQVIGYVKEVGMSYRDVWVSDHIMPWVQGEAMDADTLECWTVMSYLAAAFENLNIGSAVLCNSFRNPALLAKMASTLDALSNGRLILGLGAGWSEREYIGYGYRFPGAASRIGELEEAVQIIKRLWTEDEVYFEGKYFKLQGAWCYPRPDPTPPIMIGGSGERLMLRLVARHADWWNTHASSIETVQHKIKVLKRHCSREGRDISEIKKTVEGFVAIAEEGEEAERIASLGRQASFLGTPEDVLEQVESYVDLGIKYFILRFLDQPSTEGAKLFSEKVLSQL